MLRRIKFNCVRHYDKMRMLYETLWHCLPCAPFRIFYFNIKKKPGYRSWYIDQTTSCKVGLSYPRRSKVIIYSTKRPDQFWYSTSLLTNGHWGAFFWGGGGKTVWSRWKFWVKLYFIFGTFLYGLKRNKFTFLFTFMVPCIINHKIE
jgi:hypothetical protein